MARNKRSVFSKFNTYIMLSHYIISLIILALAGFFITRHFRPENLLLQILMMFLGLFIGLYLFIRAALCLGDKDG